MCALAVIDSTRSTHKHERRAVANPIRPCSMTRAWHDDNQTRTSHRQPPPPQHDDDCCCLRRCRRNTRTDTQITIVLRHVIRIEAAPATATLIFLLAHCESSLQLSGPPLCRARLCPARAHFPCVTTTTMCEKLHTLHSASFVASALSSQIHPLVHLI